MCGKRSDAPARSTSSTARPSHAMLNVIHSAAPRESACETLIATAIENDTKDNITDLLAEVSGEDALALTNPSSLRSMRAYWSRQIEPGDLCG